MASLQFPLTLVLLDSCLSYISAILVYKYYPYVLLGAVWLVAIVKFSLFSGVAPRLCSPSWIKSPHLYIFTLCVSSPLYQTLRFLLNSDALELHSGISHSLLSHLPQLGACLLWDFLNPITPKESTGEDENGRRKNWENFKRLVRYSVPDWVPLCLAFIFLTIALITEMFIPYYMGQMIDILSTKYKESKFSRAIYLMAFFSVMSSLSAGCRGGLFMLSLFRLTRRLKLLLFNSLVKQDIHFFEETKTGDITSRLSNDTARVSRSIAGNVNITLRMLVKCIGVYSFMFSISWKLTFLTFISSPLTWITQKVYNHYHEDLVQKVTDSIAKSSELAKEIIESVKTVQSFAAEEEEAQRYEESLQKTHKLQCNRDLVTALYLLVIRSINLGTQVSMLYYGQQLIMSGFISSGKMVSFIMYQMDSGDYIRSLVHMLSEITHSAAAAQKVFQYLDQKPLVSKKGTHCPDKLKGLFEFKNVTFSYPSRSDAALQNVSFSLPPGSVTALVGPSGGGKTTCVSLLQRFYEPQSGEILLDGKPLREYTHRFLHSKVALVAQEPVLFAGTMRYNIGYGLQDLPEEKLKEAARRANAEDFIMGMEKTFDTDVGESGSQLGVGQKLRVALARALARRPQLLILDEVSSSLDTETEHEIQQSLQNVPGLTLLIIAHRLRTIQQADQILVLKGGHINERGTHDELIEKKGIYHGLCHGHLLHNGD
ncbi:antigen peptide transporter 2-like isoform 1-T2 [Discoglossus pictus]